jgi:hypothetical protein
MGGVNYILEVDAMFHLEGFVGGGCETVGGPGE